MGCWVKYRAASEEGEEDNLLMQERLIEMLKGREQAIFLVFLYLYKAYDRVNRTKLLDVMRFYGVNRIHENLVRLIERFLR